MVTAYGWGIDLELKGKSRFNFIRVECSRWLCLSDSQCRCESETLKRISIKKFWIIVESWLNSKGVSPRITFTSRKKSQFYIMEICIKFEGLHGLIAPLVFPLTVFVAARKGIKLSLAFSQSSECRWILVINDLSCYLHWRALDIFTPVYGTQDMYPDLYA